MNETFYAFDKALLDFVHNLHAGSCGAFFDGFLKTITHVCDGGVILILLGLAFVCFRKTRRNGLAILLGLLIELIVVNLVIKTAVMRPRPYYDETSIFYQYWLDVGFGKEIDFGSFPSAHSSSIFATCLPIFVYRDKKWSWTAILFALIIAFSRIYIAVHYPSDVVGGVIVGIICSIIAILIVNAIYRYCENKEGKIANLLH